MKQTANTAFLDRLIEPVSRCFNAESARRLAALRADPEAQAAMAELAEKANEGLLSPQERAQYESCLAVGNVIALLQAKARLFLSEHGSP